MQVLNSHNFKKVIEILTCISEMQVLGMHTLSTQAQKASSKITFEKLSTNMFLPPGLSDGRL